MLYRNPGTTRNIKKYINKPSDRPTHRPADQPTKKNDLIVKLKDNKICEQRHYRITQHLHWFVKQSGEYKINNYDRMTIVIVTASFS